MKNMQSQNVTCSAIAAPPPAVHEPVEEEHEPDHDDAETVESVSDADSEEDENEEDEILDPEFENSPDVEAISRRADTIMASLDASNWIESGCSEEFIIHSLEYLDGIDISTFLYMFEDDDDNTYNYSMYIKSRKFQLTLYEDDLFTSKTFSKIHLIKALHLMIKKIETLTYCKIRNEFSNTKYIMLCGGKYLNPSKINECAICQEKTSSKTECDHFVCMQCANQMHSRLCPLCRRHMQYC